MNTISYNNKEITPSKVVCVGRNYVEHIKELDNEIPQEMVVFIKPNSAITNTLHSQHHEPLHFEGEICFLFTQGKFSAVAFGLDLTKRSLQQKLKEQGLPWERAKAFNGSALFSKFVDIETIDDDLEIRLTIDEHSAQQGRVKQMIYKPQQILVQLQDFLTLEDGDIVMTGTPKGVGKVGADSLYRGEIRQGEKVLTCAQWRAE